MKHKFETRFAPFSKGEGVKKLDHPHRHVPAHEDGRIDEILGRNLSLGTIWGEPA